MELLPALENGGNPRSLHSIEDHAACLSVCLSENVHRQRDLFEMFPLKSYLLFARVFCLSVRRRRVMEANIFEFSQLT